MTSWRRDQSLDPVEKLQRREDPCGSPVHRGFEPAIDYPVDIHLAQHAPVLAVVLALEVAPAIESRAFLVVGDQRPVGPLSSGRRLP
jgi:hypothetical protein